MDNKTKIAAMVVLVWIGCFGSLTLYFLSSKNACDQASFKFIDARTDAGRDSAAKSMQDVCGSAAKKGEAFLNFLSGMN